MDNIFWYHATKLSSVPAIIKRGIRTRAELKTKACWINLFGSKLGQRDRIYAFDDLNDAICWAAKMQFDLAIRAAVVEFSDASGSFERQEDFVHDGRAYFRSGFILPENIRRIHLITDDVVRSAIALRNARGTTCSSGISR